MVSERQTRKLWLRDLGEDFVLRKLLSMGFDAKKMPPNTPEIDIKVFRKGGGDTLFDIQVKTRLQEKRSDKNWTMNKKHETIVRHDLFYCFVKFSPDPPHKGECWILPSKAVADVLATTHRAYLAGSSTRSDIDRRNFRGDYTNRGLVEQYGPQWLEPYWEKWKIFPTS
jgi:hypothetical protein